MESLDDTRHYDREEIPREMLIFLQGRSDKKFVVLHSGLVEILYCDDPTEGESPPVILDRSIRIGLVKGEAILEAAALLHVTEPFAYSLRSVSDCIISSAPVTTEEMAKKVQRNMSLNLRIIKDMVSQIESGIYLYRNYKYLWHKMAFIADTLALSRPGEYGPEEMAGDSLTVPRKGSGLNEYSVCLHKLAKEKEGCPEPVEWDANLFQGEIQDSLRLYDVYDSLQVEDRFDYRQYLFMKRIIGKDRKILSVLFKRDEPLNFYIFDFISQTQSSVQAAVADLSREIWQLMKQIFGEGGWVRDVYEKGTASEPESNQFLYYLYIFSSRCRKDGMNLLGKDIFSAFGIFDDLKRYAAYKPGLRPPEKEEETAGAGLPAGNKKLAKYQGLLDRILKFSGLSEGFQEEFHSVMDRLLGCEDPLSPGEEAKVLRERANELYWQLYECCFLKVIDSDLRGFIPGIMLHMGVVDERFLTPEELTAVDRLYACNLYSHDPVPVLTYPYFLEIIYKSSLKPSLTEMGESFQEILKRQEKLTPKEKKNISRLFRDTPADRIHFEIDRVAKELSGLLSGNKKRFLPFLASVSMEGKPENMFLIPDETAGRIDAFRQRDYTLFYREVLLKHDQARDIIQSEVFPFFVLYPLFGNRAVMWQEMDGTRKSTPGRIFLPLFYPGKKDATLLGLLGEYRWELQKSIAGFNWTDPVEGGVVGSYYDYIQFYKKNPQITSEARKRLEDFIRRTKSDKDRFSLDYASWMTHEYEGRIKLNSYVRGIFYRFCPYPKEIRTEMAAKPLYSELEMKFQNKRQKEVMRIKSKLKKLEPNVPKELKEYLEVYLEEEIT